MSLVALATAYGGPEVLTVTDEAVGEPGPGEARIAVRAIGVNAIDYKSYSGAFGRDPSRLPLRLGSEAAGVVTAVGPDAAGPAGPALRGRRGYRLPGARRIRRRTPRPGAGPGAPARRAGLAAGRGADADRRDRLARPGGHRRARRRHGAGPWRRRRSRGHGHPARRRSRCARRRHRQPGQPRPPARARRRPGQLRKWPGGPRPGGGPAGRRRRRWTRSAPTRPSTSRWNSSPTGAGSSPSPRSPAGWNWASR